MLLLVPKKRTACTYFVLQVSVFVNTKVKKSKGERIKMGLLRLFAANAKWLFGKNDVYNFLAAPVSKGETYSHLRALFDKYPIAQGSGEINLYDVEFELYRSYDGGNTLLWQFALSKKKSQEDKFAAISTRLADYRNLPLLNRSVRLVKIFDIIFKDSQGTVSNAELAEFKSFCSTVFNLTATEIRLFDTVAELYRVKMYCLALNLLADNEIQCATKLLVALFRMDNRLLNVEQSSNERYDSCMLCGGEMVSVADCLGQTQLFYQNRQVYCDSGILVERGQKITLENSSTLYANADKHKFSKEIAVYSTATKGLIVNMNVVVKGNQELKTFEITNKYNIRQTFDLVITASPTFELSELSCQATDFDKHKVIAVTSTPKRYYYCLTVKCGDATMPQSLSTDSNGYSCAYLSRTRLTVKPKGTIKAQVVTSICDSVEQLSKTLSQIDCYGFADNDFIFTNCPISVCGVRPIDNYFRLYKNVKLPQILSSNSLNVSRSAELPLKYITRNSVFGVAPSTIADVKGQSVTLYGGYLTKIGGENVYVVCGKKVVNLCREYTNHEITAGGGITYNYDKDDCRFTLTITNSSFVKKYRISGVRNGNLPYRVVVDFKFGASHVIERTLGGFNITDVNLSVNCDMPLTCYSSNSQSLSIVNFNLNLDNDLSQGDSLTFVGAKSDKLDATITLRGAAVERATPILSNCALSAKFNYLCEQERYLLYNRLVSPNAFSLLSLCAYDVIFVENFIKTALQLGYITSLCLPKYNEVGQVEWVKDRYILTLAVLKYINMTGDKSILTRDNNRLYDFVCQQLLSTPADSNESCQLLLALSLCFSVFEDRVVFATKYQQLSSIVIADKVAYEFAQAIGALPLAKPTFDNLKELWRKFDYTLPRSYYYMVQLEKLFGVNFVLDKIDFRVDSTDSLQPLTLTYKGKIFNVAYNRGATKEVRVNEVNCYSCFNVNDVKPSINSVVVTH